MLIYDKPFDTHCHLNNKVYAQDFDEVIVSVQDSLAGATCVGFDLPSSKRAVQIAQEYDNIYATVGMHPQDTDTMSDEILNEFDRLMSYEKTVAFGEIGLDYHYEDAPNRDVQKYWFIKQFELCIQKSYPVIIHLRDAYGDMLDILRDYKSCMPKCVMHCYSGSTEIARELLDMGFYISFTGVITFKNARTLLDTFRFVPLDRLLLETDCPYLCPEPYRGEKNRPEYVSLIAKRAAELKNVEESELIRITTENAYKFFGISDK